MNLHSVQETERESPENRRSFFFLIGAMFQGAFSDNLYRLMLVVMMVGVANRTATSVEEANATAANYQSIMGALFMLPYVLAVALAGSLADRFSKTRVVRWMKWLEVAVMGLAALAFAFGDLLLGPGRGIWLGAGVLFLMGLQSALFSPARYGIMAELLPERRLAWGNGIAQGAIFVGIVLGTIAGPALFGLVGEATWQAGALLVGCGLVGVVLTYQMHLVPPANPSKPIAVEPFTPVFRTLRMIWADVGMRWSTVGVVTWWSAAMMLQGGAVLAATNVLGLGPTETGIALVPVVVAMGLGCFLASYFSSSRIELGLVPFGAAGMFVGCMIVWMAIPSPDAIAAARLSDEGVGGWLTWGLPLLIGLVASTMGFFVVPLEAFINERAESGQRGAVWAAQNVLTAVGMIIGSGFVAGLTSLRSDPADVFLGAGVLMAIAGLVICLRFPRLPLRFFVLILLYRRYRIVARGLENIPQNGGALLAPNHQSYLDGILISSVLDRPVRFVMSRMVYKRWFVYPFARLTRSIPIEQDQSPRELIAALREASTEVANGGIVCIFPEGQLTRNGMLMPFRRGIERIMKDLQAPIIPVAIDGAYDTDWALRQGRRSASRNGSFFRRGLITIVFGQRLPSQVALVELRRAVVDLMVDAFSDRKGEAEPLHRMAMRSLRARPFERSYADHNTETGPVPNLRVMAAVSILGGRLAPMWSDQECIGLLLPPSIGSLAVNIAALLGGRVPVNLNYTTSPQIMAETCATAEIRLIITSRLFVEKAKLELPAGATVVYLEDMRKEITKSEQILGMLKGLLLPIPLLERALGRMAPARMDDLATLIFSSGSTGTPKGVMLSHWNITSNIIGTLQYVECDGPDVRFLGALPFFHSFGYMSTLWLPLMRRVGVSFHPNPLDAKAIGAVVARDRVTHLFGTPTFLATYARRIEPGQFGSLRFVLTGAEKLKDFVVEGFRERFGITPAEGFGATECSPVVALNGQDYREPGVYQVGVKRGTVGQPIPCMTLRITGLNDELPVPAGEPGMLMVRGHSVMMGYYKMPDKSAEALAGGWYRTGDVAVWDEEGFLSIRDRLARFSKIGGEMVPHVRIEEALQHATGITEPVFAVTAVSDDRKGERLVVLYTVPDGKAREACDAIAGTDYNLPALWLPKWNDFVRIEAIPALGSGKMDLRAMKAIAAEEMERRAKSGTNQG